MIPGKAMKWITHWDLRKDDGQQLVRGLLKLSSTALASAAQWVRRHPTNRKATCSILGQDTCLGHGFGPSRGAYKKNLIDVSLSHQ